MKNLKLNFRFSEILVLFFEIYLFAAGLLMLMAASGIAGFDLYVPAKWLASSLPAMLTVCFAFWLVFRLRSIRAARNRGWALGGAACLALVAMSFGAGIGKLNMVFSTNVFENFIDAAIQDPDFKRAGLFSMLAFTAIGFVFGITFVRRAARGPWMASETSEEVRTEMTRLSRLIISDWDERLVCRIDSLLEQNDNQAAVALVKEELGFEHEQAVNTIADWPEHRLLMQVQLLRDSLENQTEEPINSQDLTDAQVAKSI